MNRVISKAGFNLPSHQLGNSEWVAQKSESVLVPSSSLPNWGSYFNIKFTELNVLVQDITLQFNLGALSGSGSTYFAGGAWLFIDHIEIVQHNKIIATHYGQEQFLNNQLWYPDETRKLINQSAGDYSSQSQRTAMASTANSYYLNLFTYFEQSGSGIPILDVSHNIELRVYLRNLVDIVNGGSSPSCTINSVNGLFKVVRLRNNEADIKRMEVYRRPYHFKANELRYMPLINVASGVSTVNIVLQGITGRISLLMFTVRPTSGINNDNMDVYTAISSFNILNNANQNISGGQPITSAMALNVLSRDWVSSSYLSETALGTVNNGANVYLYSFSSDPTETMKYGISNGHHLFTGNEILQINFTGTLGASVAVDVMAYSESVVEIGHNFVHKKDFR